MKRILTTLFCFTWLNCHAQKDPRIVIVRDDQLWVRQKKHAILLNHDKIGKIGDGRIFIYDSKNSAGDYFVRAHNHKVVTLNPEKQSVTFLQVKVNPNFLYGFKSSIKKITVADFQELYRTNEWLRKRLKKAGYNSVEELTAGYNSVN